jgi:hypothetical protein
MSGKFRVSPCISIFLYFFKTENSEYAELMIFEQLDKFTLKTPNADIFISLLVFSMKIFTVFATLWFPLYQFEWNRASESFDDAIESSLPK